MALQQQLRQQAAAELTENILPFWMLRTQASDGGFHGRIDGNGALHEDSPRGGVLNARILWTFSSAYRLTGREEYLRTALKARDQILGPFWDNEFGGTYWSIKANGMPEDTKKQIYTIAFAIYGLSELYRASGDELSLAKAKELFRAIEDHSFDKVRNGYMEAYARDWSPLQDMRLSEKDQNDAKTMNTHLHILEAYTALYRVWKDNGLGIQLRNLIEIFLDRIILPSGHFALFFDEDWNLNSATLSYGHDIEGSWLLTEAAEVLGDETLLERVHVACAKIAEAALEGWTPEGGMVYEMHPDGRIDGDRHWWVQAETVVGSVWQWKHTGDDIWLERAMQEWTFIKEHIINPEGEWFWSCRADGSTNREDDLAGPWKCPYHNGRMCMEMMERL